jgi:hypothetical protein
MSEVERRDVLIASVGLATAAFAAASPAQAGDSSFMNNVPDPLLSGGELPTLSSPFHNVALQIKGEFQPWLGKLFAARVFIVSDGSPDEACLCVRLSDDSPFGGASSRLLPLTRSRSQV